ncbi:MAG: FtsQ-type POTRA domain-containing protein [Gammaproteobacteria bacterium]|nr:FtsQ-type POTRA domain-containing protein [Gammaproteobacteria bacterium]
MILGERPRPQAAMREPPRPIRWGRWLLAAGAIVLVIGVQRLVVRLADPDVFPIRRVTVDGEFRYLAAQHIEALVVGAVRGGFFQVDVAQIRAQLLREAWVRDATVQRVWPIALHVSIREQQPVARWGEASLLSAAGEVFTPDPKTFPNGLVQLSGSTGTQAEVLAVWQRARATLKTLGLTATALRRSDRGAWQLELADGTLLLLGRHVIDQRLARFVRAYPRVLKDHWARIAAIDLRYTNGFSLRQRAGLSASGAATTP